MDLFKLNLFKELSKYFKVDFAALIEFSLQIIHILKSSKELNEEL